MRTDNQELVDRRGLLLRFGGSRSLALRPPEHVALAVVGHLGSGMRWQPDGGDDATIGTSGRKGEEM